MNQSATIVQRLWNYCNVLRDDGMSYGDYLEQLTFLLFLKMDDERVRELGLPSAIHPEYNWPALTRLDGDALETHYRNTLIELGKGSGLIPVIFRKAQNKIQDPAKLRRLVTLIEGETWIGLGICLVLSGGIYFWLRPHLGSMHLPALFYIIVITVMVVGAWSVIGNSQWALTGRVFVFVGAVSFYFSDVFVARDRFLKPEFLNRLIGLPLYYLGQFLLAFSVGFLR